MADISEIVRQVRWYEVSLMLLTIPFLICYCIAVIRQRVFECDLLILLINVAVCYFLILISRTVFLITSFWTVAVENNMLFVIMGYFSFAATFARCMNAVIITIERMTSFATQKGYEKYCCIHGVPFYAITLITFQWSLSFFYCIKVKKALFAIAWPYYAYIFMYLITFGTFAVLPRLSRIIYQKNCRQLITKCHLSLEVRFHRLRTFKSSRILYPMMLFDAVMSAVWVVVSITQVPNYGQEIMVILLSVAVPIQAIGVSFAFLYSSGELRRFFGRKNEQKEITQGRCNAITPMDQMKIYFEGYAKSW